MKKKLLKYSKISLIFILLLSFLSLKGEASPLLLNIKKQPYSFIHFDIDNKSGFRIVSSYQIPLSKRVEIVVHIGNELLKRKKLKYVARDIQLALSYQTHLAIEKQGVLNILKYLKNKPIGFQSVIWNQVGKIKDSRGRYYKNRLIIYIENRSNKKVEKKIRLGLINKYNRNEFSRQFTLSANAHDFGTFDLSEYFQFLPKRGEKTLIYDVKQRDKNIVVRSSNKEVFIVNLIKGQK